jgi:hypothetical protein
MKKLQCVGAGFNPDHSSCSNLSPSGFSWTTQDQENQVLIDNAILYATRIEKKPDQKRYGWDCESSAIVPQLAQALEDFSDVIFEDGEFELIFTNDKRLLDLDEERFVYSCTGSNLPWIPKESWGMHDKIKLCSMVASAKVMCKGHEYRQETACKFKDQIDLFGGACGSERIGISSNLNDKWNDKRSAMIPYMFSIVMENRSSPYYYTEKLTDCFSVGTIPVYWGATDLGDFFDDRGIIRLTDDFTIDQLTPELYEEMLPYAGNNYALVQSLEMADDELANKIL